MRRREAPVSRFATVGVRPVTKLTGQQQSLGQEASGNAVAHANSSAETPPETPGTQATPTSSTGTKPLIPIRRLTPFVHGQTRIFLSGGPPPKAK